MSHQCRESSDPRHAGYCACGKKMPEEKQCTSWVCGNEDHPGPCRSEETLERYGAIVREFDTGATRDTDEGKLDYAGFLSSRVLRRFAAYMHSHRIQSDGTLRDSDNWKKGIPLDAYFSSAFRHFVEWWEIHEEGLELTDDLDAAEEAICALLFNVMGYLHTIVDS